VPSALNWKSLVGVALWRDHKGQMHGVLQGYEGSLPPVLAGITDDWLRLGIAGPMDCV